jgi:hypothetical protein
VNYLSANDNADCTGSSHLRLERFFPGVTSSIHTGGSHAMVMELDVAFAPDGDMGGGGTVFVYVCVDAIVIGVVWLV